MKQPKSPPVLSWDDIVNTAACPQCGAAKGAACSWGTAKNNNPHSRRVRAAMRAAGWSNGDQERWRAWLSHKYAQANQERLDAHRRAWPEGTPDQNPNHWVPYEGEGGPSWHVVMIGRVRWRFHADVTVHASGRYHWKTCSSLGGQFGGGDYDSGFCDKRSSAFAAAFDAMEVEAGYDLPVKPRGAA